MDKRTLKSYDADGSEEHLKFDPDKLVIVPTSGHLLSDERSGMEISEEFIQNVAAFGVMQTISVRRNGQDGDGKPIMEVVAGRRRVLAAREVNRRNPEIKLLVPAIVVRSHEFERMVSENTHREPENPMHLARKLQRFLDLGHTVEEAPVVFNVTAVGAKRLLTLLECAPEVQTAVETKELSPHNARKLAVMPAHEQLEELAKLRGEVGTKGAAATESIEKRKGKRGRAKAPAKYRSLPPKILGAAFEKAPDILVKARDVMAWVMRQGECPWKIEEDGDGMDAERAILGALGAGAASAASLAGSLGFSADDVAEALKALVKRKVVEKKGQQYRVAS